MILTNHNVAQNPCSPAVMIISAPLTYTYTVCLYNRIDIVICYIYCDILEFEREGK